MQLPSFLKSKKFWRWFIVAAFFSLFSFLTVVIGIFYAKQDEVVQGLIQDLNKDFRGRIEIKDSHISPFNNFPYISIDLEEVKVFENKEDSSVLIVNVSEVFLGFDFWTVVSGNLNINDIKLKDGRIDLVKHIDGRFNIEIALTSEVEVKNPNEEFHLAIHEIELDNIELRKLNEENSMLFDAVIFGADAKFKTSNEHTSVHFDSMFELNVINDGDTSFIRHKQFYLETELDYNNITQTLSFEPTSIHLENSEFEMKGSIDFKNDMDVDFKISGKKQNYNLVLAMVPEDLKPTLKKYENKGSIFFETSIKGKTLHGQSPAINAVFGCENGYFKNTEKNKEVKDLNFTGTFTNGENRDPSTMRLQLMDFTASPEEGRLSATLEVNNFNDPEIEFQINTSFELNFLAEFFNITNLQDLGGTVELEMNFHDIVNINAPQHTIEKLNQSYKSQLKVTDLHFKYGTSDIPLEDLDLLINMDGHQAVIEYCEMKIGESDIKLHGDINDLPAVLHHTNKLIDTRLVIESSLIDIYELTGGNEHAFNEKIKNLKLDLDFKSSAQALTEFKNLPSGEFFIENLYADLQNYPHTLHDFHLDVIIDKENFKLLDFKGVIDKSDFLFSGNLKHYDIWFADTLRGNTEIDFDFKSNHLRLKDLLAYNGENYVSKDYRHEELDNFKFHGNTKIHFQDSLESIDIKLNHFNAKMKVHPLKLTKVSSRVHYEKKHLIVEDFKGVIGQSDFKSTLHYYLGKNESIKKRENHFAFQSTNLDIDELINYNANPKDKKKKDHDSVFNFYELPFTDMTFDIAIQKLNYHNYNVDQFNAKMHSTPQHYLYIDTLSMGIAGGKISTKGYFNGSNPKLIYFSPDLYVEKIDLDKLFLKFDNFGQDHLISENLHGEFTGHITGKVHVHTDLVPKLDDSEIHMDAHIENGRLENLALLDSFADYFKNQNLESVRFDTLENKMDIKNGEITIPKMTVNSTLGFMEVSGKQDADFNFEYDISVPWELVNKAIASKLFKRKNKDGEKSQDEIQYANENTKFVSIKLKGDSLDYSVTLSKRKK